MVGEACSRAFVCLLVGVAACVVGCGDEVTVAPGPEPSEPVCPELTAGEPLTSLEFAELVQCHHPPSAWRLLELRSGSLDAKSDENVGRAPTWSAMLHGEESLRVRDGSNGWSVEAADAEPYVPCGSDASIEVPDSEAIMEHGAVSGLNVDFRMTHACVVDGTCGNVWVATTSLSFHYTWVYAPDGTYLFDTFTPAPGSCPAP